MPPELPSSNSEPVRLRSVPIERSQQDAVGLGAPRNLPKPLTSLIGRDADIAAVRALLVEEGARLLTLTGPGGVGKTRLALRIGEEVGEAFPDGVVFVPLATITDPELVLSTIARELGLREVGTRSAADLVADYLRHRRVLLVLDNFEQVRPVATRLAALLAICPDVVALVTSRALLHVAGERRFPVAPLALPDPAAVAADRSADPPLITIASSAAVQLFLARAKAIDPRFTFGANNAAAIAAICRQLDGLPLAIELAAVWVPVLPPSALLARLGRRLPLLHGGGDDQPARLRTMRDAIAWSYDLLSSDEARLFRCLAVFVGGFTLEAAEWVSCLGVQMSDEGISGVTSVIGDLPPPARHLPPATLDTLDLVASLVDKSLLRRTETGDATRLEMLETIREFGVERLEESAETESIAARHATWCVNLAEGVRRAGGMSQGRSLAILEAEHPNLRAALGWLLARGETTVALHLAGLLAEFWMRHGHWAEGQAWLERTLAADGGPTARAGALVGLNMMLWPRDEFAAAQHVLREAEMMARATGDAGTLAYTRLHQGYVALFQGDFDLAGARGEEALKTAGTIPQAFSLNGALWLLARVALARREDERAAVLYDRLLAAAHAAEDEISLANGLYGKAILAERRAEFDRALAGFAEAAGVCRGFGDRMHASQCLDGAAAAAAALGYPELAVRLLAAAYSLRVAIGAPPISEVDHDRADHEQALAPARAALGTVRFAAAWAAGLAISLDEAIAEATTLAHQLISPESGHPGVRAAGLTAREREVLRLLVDGWSDKEIAVALGIGRRTASHHVATIRAKLGAPSRTAAATLAVRDHLV